MGQRQPVGSSTARSGREADLMVAVLGRCECELSAGATSLGDYTMLIVEYFLRVRWSAWGPFPREKNE